MKRYAEELSVLGGKPAFDRVLHVGQPNIGNRSTFRDRMDAILDSRWLTNNGQFVQEFEDRVAHHLGTNHCVAMCNGTVALEIAVRALGLTGEVIIPSFTFVATAHCLQWQEITPLFADVDLRSHTLDPEEVARHITPRTTGIIGVHLWGNPCNVDALQEVADRHGLALLFDAAHAFGSSYRGTRIGSFGNAEVLSFHATKFVNSFEGGAVVTNDDALADKMRLMRNFGFAGLDRVIYLGTNGKMSEPCAAMGLTSLESIESFIDHNRSIYSTYRRSLDGVPGLRVFPFNEGELCNFQYVVAEVDEGAAGLSRDALMSVLHAENIRCRRYFFPGCHNMEPYLSYYPDAALMLPNTEALSQRILCFPTGMSVSTGDVAEICNIVDLAVANSPRIKRLAERQVS